MKNKTIIIFTAVLVIISCLNLSVFAAGNRQLLICDNANAFSNDQKAALFDRFDSSAIIADCALVIYTSDLAEVKLSDAAADLESRYPNVTQNGYVMLYINTAKDDILTAASGAAANEEFSKEKLESLTELMVSLNQAFNLFEAADWFIVYCSPDSSSAEEKWKPAIPSDYETKPEKREPVKLEINPFTAVISAAALSLICGIIAVLITNRILRNELRSIQARRGASYYIAPGNTEFKITHCSWLHDKTTGQLMFIIMSIPRYIKNIINKIRKI